MDEEKCLFRGFLQLKVFPNVIPEQKYIVNEIPIILKVSEVAPKSSCSLTIRVPETCLIEVTCLSSSQLFFAFFLLKFAYF